MNALFGYQWKSHGFESEDAGSRSLALCGLAMMAMASFASVATGQASPFVDSIDVRVVNVETVVTDKNGTRVFGLEPDEFRLWVDGEQVPIDYFTEVRGGDVLRQTGHSPAARPITDGQARGTSYLVFVDDFFSIKTDRQRVLDGLLDELDFLGENDRMAIVAWDGRRLEMLSSWSSTERQLRRALQQAMARPAGGLHRLSEELRVRSTPLRRSRLGNLSGFRFNIEERAYVHQLSQQVENLVTAASATLRGFAEPPGRKVMLLASGGWPFSPGDFVAGNSFDASIEFDFERGWDLYRPLIETANLLGYTLYPIDSVGIARRANNDVTFSAPRRAVYGDPAFFREWEQHTTLRYLAEATGGKALLNGQRAEPLRLVYEDTRSFYWLGFVPDREWDDSQHVIEVEALGKGLETRARSSFSDLSKQQEVAMVVESSLLFGLPASRDGLEVKLGVPRKLKLGKVEVPITITIPLHRVALLPIGDDLVGTTLELRLAAMDERGNRSDIPNIPIEVRRSSADSDESIVYETTLKMRKQAHDLVVAVYDPATGELMSAQASVGL